MVAVASHTHESRRAAEERLVALRQKLQKAQAEKKAREKELAVALHADRIAVRDQVREIRTRALAHLRDQVTAARNAAKLTRLSRLEEARRVYGGTIEGIKAEADAERRYQADLVRIDREERVRRTEIHQAHERSVAANAVRSALLGKVEPIVTRSGQRVFQGPGESRGEAVLRHAKENVGKVHAAIDPRLASTIEATERAVREEETRVRALGGNVNVRPPRPASAPKKSSSLAPRGKGKASKSTLGAIPVLPRAAAPAIAGPALSRSKPKTTAKKAAKKTAPKKTAAAKKSSRGSVAPASPMSPATRAPVPTSNDPRPRRKGKLPRSGGMLLEALLRERAEIATANAARAKRGAKAPRGSRATPAPAPVPPAPMSALVSIPPAANSNVIPPALANVLPTSRPPTTASTLGSVASTYAGGLKPYRVRASCGHVVIRKMSEVTAGVPYSEDVVIDAPLGRACDACEAKKGANAPRPATENEVKAPELRDTAQIAARIRADIAEAVRKGRLPPAKYSVRTSKYSMGSSMAVEASALPFPVLNVAAFHREGPFVSFNRDKFQSRYTPQAETVHAKLEAIVKAYHWDKSDLMTDYHHSRFHYDVRLDEGDEFKRIEETLKRAAATSATTTSVAGPKPLPVVTAPKPPPASLDPLQLEPQNPASPTTHRGPRPRRVQQSLVIDAPLLHGAPKPSGIVIPFPAPTTARGAEKRERRYRDGEIVESKWGEKAEIEGWAPTEYGGLIYRVVRGLDRGERIHDQWPAEVIVRTVPKSRESAAAPASKPPPNADEANRGDPAASTTSASSTEEPAQIRAMFSEAIDAYRRSWPSSRTARANASHIVAALGKHPWLRDQIPEDVLGLAQRDAQADRERARDVAKAATTSEAPAKPRAAKRGASAPSPSAVQRSGSPSSRPSAAPAPKSAPDFDAALERYLRRLQENVNASHTRMSKSPAPTLTIEPGRRYLRVVRTDAGGSRGVLNFIDTTNGDILKPDGKRPAPGKRGSIFDPAWSAPGSIAVVGAATDSPTPSTAEVDASEAPRAPNAYEQRKAARVDRLRARSEKLHAEAQGAFAREHALESAIPLGQPILVGHHSEKRHRRDIERMRSLASKGVALSKQADELARRADAAEESTAISSDDPEALTKLREKLARLEKLRTRMREVNAAIRKGGDAVPRLVALGFSEADAKKLLEKDFAGRIGIPSYKLKNASAEEGRIKERIRVLEARESSPPPPTVTIGDGTIAEAANRVRVTFPAVPPEAVRRALKGEGFRWSPTEGAWQRFASPGAWAAARRVLSAHQTPEAPASPNAPPLP